MAQKVPAHAKVIYKIWFTHRLFNNWSQSLACCAHKTPQSQLAALQHVLKVPHLSAKPLNLALWWCLWMEKPLADLIKACTHKGSLDGSPGRKRGNKYHSSILFPSSGWGEIMLQLLLSGRGRHCITNGTLKVPPHLSLHLASYCWNENVKPDKPWV